MKLIRYALMHFKRIIKNPIVIILMFLMPTIVIGIVGYGFSKDTSDNSSGVAFAVEDKGDYGYKFLENIKVNNSNSIYDLEEEALKPLEKDDVIAVYVIPENFTEKIKAGEKPTIKSFKREVGNGTSLLESVIEEELTKALKQEILVNNKLFNSDEGIKSTIKIVEKRPEGMTKGFYMTIILIMNFILFSASSVGTELISMKKDKILSRAITTSNRGWEIMGGLYLGFFLIQMSIYTVVLFVEKTFLGFSFGPNLPLLLVNMALLILISISLGLAVTRVVENEGVAALIINLFGIVTTFISMGATVLGGDNMPSIVKTLGKFTPQYWALTSIDTSVLFPNAIILLLMALAIFTAGSFKLRTFANK